jgi:hypothetical protein
VQVAVQTVILTSYDEPHKSNTGVNMSHVAHLSLQTKPGSFQKVCDRYHQFASEVLAGHPDLHDVIIMGN